MPSPSSKTDNTIPGSVLTEKQVHYLKIANIVMGVILVVGFLVLVIGIYFKAQEAQKAQKKTAPETIPVSRLENTPPVPPVLPLPEKITGFSRNITVKTGAGAKVRTVTRNGHLLQLVVDEKTGTSIYFIDLTTGKTATHIQVPGDGQ